MYLQTSKSKAFDIELFYTGIVTAGGEKVYLGDKLVGPYYHPMLVQYDFAEQKFIVTTTGKSLSPYRKYIIEDLAQLPGLRIMHNTLIYRHAKVGDIVRISVDNIKNNLFALHEDVRITEVQEWVVIAEALNDPLKKAEVRFGEFLEAWRINQLEK